MSFRKFQPEEAAKKKGANAVRVKRSYYTFSKNYPAGNADQPPRKSMSQLRRKKRIRTGLIAAGISLLIVTFLLIWLL